MAWRYDQYFTVKEMSCKCGCGFLPSHEFMDILFAIRSKVNFPMVISSGGRCPAHNNRVSASGYAGPHTIGAADVLIYGERLFELVRVAYDFGITGFGYNQSMKIDFSKRYLHMDAIRKGEYSHIPRPNVWGY